MDCDTSYVSCISKSLNYIFGSCLMLMQYTVCDMCDCVNKTTIDCMLSRRREKFKTKTAISSNYVIHVLYLLTTE